MSNPIKKIDKYHIVDTILISNITPPETPIHACSYKSIKILSSEPDSAYKYAIHNFIKFDRTLSKDYIPKPGDKLFFHKGCTVLREKVRQFAAKNNVSITVKRDNATVEFISKTSVNSYFSELEDGIFPVEKEDFIKFIELNYKGELDYLCEDVRKLSCKYVFVKDNMHLNIQLIFLTSPSTTWQSSVVRTTVNSLRIQHEMNSINPAGCNYSHRIGKSYTRIIDDNDYKILSGMTGSKNLFLQDEITKLINDDSVVIDNDIYTQLDSMLSSGQEADAQVAIEIMANANLDASLGRIMLLLKEHYNKVSHYRCCKHVNFKSLIAYIGQSPSTLNIDRIIDILINKELMTEEYFLDILSLIKEDVQKHINFGSGSKHFKVSKITCSEELLKAIGKTKNVEYAGNREGTD